METHHNKNQRISSEASSVSCNYLFPQASYNYDPSSHIGHYDFKAYNTVKEFDHQFHQDQFKKHPKSQQSLLVSKPEPFDIEEPIEEIVGFEQGTLGIYKVWLIVSPLFMILFAGVTKNILLGAINLLLLYACFVQYLAIEKKCLQKAKSSFLCSKIYMASFVAIQIASIVIYRNKALEHLFFGIIGLAQVYICVFCGANKVLKAFEQKQIEIEAAKNEKDDDYDPEFYDV